MIYILQFCLFDFVIVSGYEMNTTIVDNKFMWLHQTVCVSFKKKTQRSSFDMKVIERIRFFFLSLMIKKKKKILFKSNELTGKILVFNMPATNAFNLI